MEITSFTNLDSHCIQRDILCSLQYNTVVLAMERWDIFLISEIYASKYSDICWTKTEVIIISLNPQIACKITQNGSRNLRWRLFQTKQQCGLQVKMAVFLILRAAPSLYLSFCKMTLRMGSCDGPTDRPMKAKTTNGYSGPGSAWFLGNRKWAMSVMDAF